MNDRPTDKARELVDRLRLKSPPVPVEKLAKLLGVRIEYNPFDDELSGMAFLRDGKPIVGVNSTHHPNRQRFTIAHELGHVLLHRPELEMAVMIDKGRNFLARDPGSAAGTDILEVQANAFASELLMPTQLLHRTLLDYPGDLNDDDYVMSLAKRFRVSLTALQLRLEKL